MQITKIKKKINKKKLFEITSIIQSENKSSIISSLSKRNIVLFLEKTIESKKLELFVATYKKRIVGYAIVALRNKYLKQVFNQYILNFLFDLIFRLKIVTLLNASMSYMKLDNIFLGKFEKEKISNSINLNMIAIHKKHQSKGIGEKLMKFIIKDFRKDSNYISCEIENLRSKKFYQKKLGFKQKKLNFGRFFN